MAQQDACTFLDEEHDRVEDLFRQYNGERDDERKRALTRQMCQDLKVHMEIEDEIFYPAFRAATQDDKLVQQSEHEHNETRDLIIRLEEAQALDDATMKKLQDVVRDHVKDERTKMFPKARESNSMDLVKLADQLKTRRKQILTGQPA